MARDGITLSHTKMIETLEVGESFPRVERLPIDDADAETINATMNRVRGAANQVANRIRKQRGSDFRVESVSMLAPDRSAILCMAVTTRIEPEEEEIDI